MRSITPIRSVLWLLFVVAMTVPPDSGAATFYVTPEGNDAWSGGLEASNADKSDGPWRTLQGARDAVRRWKAANGLSEPVRVVVAGGKYDLREPLVFQPEDSGTEACPIVYEAAAGTRPFFSGGRVISGFRPVDGGIWQTQIPDVKSGSWYFEQLFVNGRRATRARSPNRFYYYMANKVPRGVDPLTGQPADLSARAFRARAGDVKPWPNLRDVTLVVYHSWEISRLRLASVDPATNTVITTGPAVWPFLQWGPSQRYHVENFREALDAPGEWFLDRDGTLSYLPLPGEDPASAEFVAPVTSEFVRFAGTARSGPASRAHHAARVGFSARAVPVARRRAWRWPGGLFAARRRDARRRTAHHVGAVRGRSHRDARCLAATRLQRLPDPAVLSARSGCGGSADWRGRDPGQRSGTYRARDGRQLHYPQRRAALSRCRRACGSVRAATTR